MITCVKLRKNALKYIAVRKWVHEFNMDMFSTGNSAMFNGVDKLLLYVTD